MKTVMSPNELLKYGADLFTQHEFEELKNLSETCLEMAFENEVGWILKAVSYIAMGNSIEAFKVIDNSAQAGLNSIVLTGQIGQWLLDLKAYDLLAPIRHKVSNRYDAAIWLYLSGCGQMMNGDHDGAFECFDAFIPALQPIYKQGGLEPFLTNTLLNTFFRQGKLCCGPNETARRIAAYDENVRKPKLEIKQPVKGSGPIFFTSCNGIYFENFGEEFARRLLTTRPKASLYIHICLPGPDTNVIYQKISDNFPGRTGFGITTSPPYDTTTYFTCERFFIAEKLVNDIGRPVVSLDLDVALTGNAPDFHDFANSSDVAWYDTGRNEPASVCQASAIMWGSGKGTRHFLRALQAFCFAGDFENPYFASWQLDQAALYSVRHYFQKRHPNDIKFADMSLDASSFEDSLKTFVSEPEKDKLKEMTNSYGSKSLKL